MSVLQGLWPFMPLASWDERVGGQRLSLSLAVIAVTFVGFSTIFGSLRQALGGRIMSKYDTLPKESSESPPEPGGQGGDADAGGSG
jgi:hypothetical protein